MLAAGQPLSSLEHRGFVVLHNVLVAFDSVLDPSFPLAVHNWRFVSGTEEVHLAGVQHTCCYIREGLECAAVADTGSFASRRQIGPQIGPEIALGQPEQLFACSTLLPAAAVAHQVPET